MSQSPRLVARILTIYLVASTLLAVCLGWFATASASAAREQAQAASIEFLLRRTLDQWSADGLDPNSADLSRRLESAARESGIRLTLLSTTGKPLWDSEKIAKRIDDRKDEDEIQKLAAGSVESTRRFERSGADWQMFVALPWRNAAQDTIAVLRAGQSTDQFPAATTIDPRAATAAIWGAVSLFGALLIYRYCKPLEEMARAAERVVAAPTLEKLPRQSLQELQVLGDAFNTLVEQFEERGRTIGRKGTEQEAVLSSMVEGVLAVDSDERIITINRAAAVLVGIPVAEAPGKSLQVVLRNADLRRFVLRALESLVSIEDDIVLHGERNRILQASGTALRDARGRAIGAVIVLNDVTHTRHLENIRRDFVANVSHELKTPIAGIKGFVETLLDGAMHEPHDAERFLRIVARQADRLDTIIEDLLSLSKIEQSEEAGNLPLERMPLRGLLEGVLEDFQAKAAERQVAIELACDDALNADVNPRLLEQAIINLIDNAIKYSEAGGRVELAAAEYEHEVVISVRDHGCGIDNEHLPRLFERFYRVDKARSRKLGGTGLGLAIVKHIVQAHRGRIDVESVPGQGSVFSIRLPRAGTGTLDSATQ